MTAVDPFAKARSGFSVTYVNGDPGDEHVETRPVPELPEEITEQIDEYFRRIFIEPKGRRGRVKIEDSVLMLEYTWDQAELLEGWRAFEFRLSLSLFPLPVQDMPAALAREVQRLKPFIVDRFGPNQDEVVCASQVTHLQIGWLLEVSE